MSTPIRIFVDDISSDSDSESVSSYSTLTPSPTRIPVASRIRNIATEVVPYDDEQSSSTFYIIEDETHYNNSCLFINFINCFLFFLFVLINRQYFDYISPNVESLFYRAISDYPKCNDIRHEIWRLFTYSFVHNGFLHLIGNSLGMFTTTTFIFRFQNFSKIMMVYVISVINGALSYYLTDPYSILIGSSGGVYGLFGSHIANYLYNYNAMINNEKLFIYIFNFTFVIIDLINYFFLYSESVAYQVHWYSFIFGLLSGLVLFKEKKATQYKKNLRILALILFCYSNSLLLFNYIFNFPSEKHFYFFKLKSIDSCCYELIHFQGNITDYKCTNIKNTIFL